MRKSFCEKGDTTRGNWTKEEDQKLTDYIKAHGEGCWTTLPMAAGLQRSGKSCRLRWKNYLRPDIKRGHFGDAEEDLIIKLHALLGNRWSLIAGRLQGRTDKEVENYWNSHLKRKLIAMGIEDPNNHSVHQTLGSPSLTATAQCCLPSSDEKDAADSSSACVSPGKLVHDSLSGSCSSNGNVQAASDSVNSSPPLNLDLTIASASSSSS